jgi:hypothetical protein
MVQFFRREEGRKQNEFSGQSHLVYFWWIDWRNLMVSSRLPLVHHDYWDSNRFAVL